jgi:MFS family permease
MEQGRGVSGASQRLASWLAWAVCALSLTLTALDFLLIALNVSMNTPSYVFWPELTSLAVGYSVIGAIIASRLPKHPIGWLCCAIGFIAAVDHFAGGYSLYALVAQPHPLTGGRVMLWLQGWFWMLFIGLIVYLLLLFPTGRLPSSRWRPFAWASVAVISAAVIWSSVISPDVGFNAPPSPVQLSVLLLGGVAAGSVIVGRRNARGVERQQIKWLLYVGPLFFIAAGLHVGFYYFWLTERSWGLWASYLLVAIGGLSGPIAIGIAILRYRLYEIDLIINRTLVYGSLTATLVALYFGGIVVLQRVFVLLTGQQSTLAVVASTLLIAALFTPLRRRIQAFIDRSFYRRKYDAAKTLEEFSMKLRDETDLKALNNDLVGVVRGQCNPPTSRCGCVSIHT